MKIKRSTMKIFAKVAAVVLGMSAASAFAAYSGVTVSAIQGNFSGTVKHLAVMLQGVSLVAGVGFVMASFFKFHQHKLNPTQVPLSQGITLLLIGAALILFPTMLPTATKAAFGVGASGMGKVSGAGISGLIG